LPLPCGQIRILPARIEGAHYRVLTGEEFRQILGVIDVARSCNEPAVRFQFFRVPDNCRNSMASVERFVQNCRTDEYRAGRPIRELQHLLGHKSVRTPEIYLKELIPETVRPNERPMIAGIKIDPSQWVLSLEGNADGSPTSSNLGPAD
jgi:hypothetical protein